MDRSRSGFHASRRTMGMAVHQQLLDAKAAKKGVIDMHKFYPGKKSHPPKMQIFSKYDNRKGTRSYDERKEMYDVGTDVVRPKMLASMWDEKFSAWLTENPENE